MFRIHYTYIVLSLKKTFFPQIVTDFQCNDVYNKINMEPNEKNVFLFLSMFGILKLKTMFQMKKKTAKYLKLSESYI